MKLNLVDDNSLKATNNGYQLQVRLDWYRSLPLSCVEQVRLSLDGEQVDAQAITFGINGGEYRLDELAALTDQVWFVLDSATIRVEQPGQVTSGKSYTIEAEMALRAPYIAIGPGRFLTITSRYSTTQVAS